MVHDWPHVAYCSGAWGHSRDNSELLRSASVAFRDWARSQRPRVEFRNKIRGTFCLFYLFRTPVMLHMCTHTGAWVYIS